MANVFTIFIFTAAFAVTILAFFVPAIVFIIGNIFTTFLALTFFAILPPLFLKSLLEITAQ